MVDEMGEVAGNPEGSVVIGGRRRALEAVVQAAAGAFDEPVQGVHLREDELHEDAGIGGPER
jgi:hypothetical protein